MDHQIIVNYPGENSVTLNCKYNIPDVKLLERVFAWFNHGSGEECQTFLNEKMRSLAVNDFVRINKQWYQCDWIGWEAVSADRVAEVEKAVIQHRDFAKHGGRYCLHDVMSTKYQKADKE